MKTGRLGGGRAQAEEQQSGCIVILHTCGPNPASVAPACQLPLRLPAACPLGRQLSVQPAAHAHPRMCCLAHVRMCSTLAAGVDPTPEQWQGMLEAVRSRSLLPFFDSAYQASLCGSCIELNLVLLLFDTPACCPSSTPPTRQALFFCIDVHLSFSFLGSACQASC